METFELKGKLISREQVPAVGLHVEAFDKDPVLKPDDDLGKTNTDSNGFFVMRFDKSKFNDFWETLDGTPDIYLVVRDDKERQLLETGEAKTKREIEYHIRLDRNVPNPEAADPYSGNARRMLNMLAEVGELIGIENRINLDLLNNGDPTGEIKKDLSNFINGYEDRRNNFDQFIAILTSLTGFLAEESRVGNIGYDGAQVPKLPRRVPYDQVIIWPRQEEFKWA